MMDPVLLTSMVKLSVLVMVNGQDVIVQVSNKEKDDIKFNQLNSCNKEIKHCL